MYPLWMKAKCRVRKGEGGNERMEMSENIHLLSLLFICVESQRYITSRCSLVHSVFSFSLTHTYSHMPGLMTDHPVPPQQNHRFDRARLCITRCLRKAKKRIIMNAVLALTCPHYYLLYHIPSFSDLIFKVCIIIIFWTKL